MEERELRWAEKEANQDEEDDDEEEEDIEETLAVEFPVSRTGSVWVRSPVE